MNHAQKNEYIKELEQSLKNTQKAVFELLKYMQLPKYHCGDQLDNYINISDVQSFTSNILFNITNNSMDFNE